MSLDLEKPLQVNTFGFNLPCREFVVSAQITRDRRLPLVDEYILRALNLVEAISVQKLARYFGFEGSELSIALADLQARSLVSVSGEQVSLHSSAKELFRTADGPSPTIASVESFHARVWFDLVSQGMVTRGMHNVRHLLSLQPLPSKVDLGADFAREAFDANFRDYLRNVRNIRNADQWSLYAILDVQSGRYSNAQVASSEQLVISPKARMEPVFWDGKQDGSPRVRQLTEAMVQALRELEPALPSIGARSDYRKLVESSSLDRSVSQEGFCDLRNWLRLESQFCGAFGRPFVGYIYIEHNRKELLSLLSQLTLSKVVAEGPFEMQWLRPGGSNWGRTEDVRDFLSELRSQVREWASGKATPSFALLAPPIVSAKTLTSFNRLFDSAAQTKPGRFAAGLEVLIMPGAFAVVSVMVSLTRDVSVPIGLMTVEPKAVAEIEQRARLVELASDGTSTWRKEQRDKQPDAPT